MVSEQSGSGPVHMSKVIPIRKEKPKAVARNGDQYFCTRCDGGEFRLTSLGMVHCAHCGALMKNLLVSPK